MIIENSKKKIIIVSPPDAQQFVLNDVEILNNIYDVILIEGLKKYNILKLFSTIKKCDFVLCWFGCRTTAFAVKIAKYYKKKVAVIAGGQDAVKIPEIKYGLTRNIFHKIFVKYAFEKSDIVLPVSNTIKNELVRVAMPKNIHVLYNGVKINDEEKIDVLRKGVLCAARITKDTIKLKGIESILSAAKLIPDVPFTIVGYYSNKSLNILKHLINSNVNILGKIPNEMFLNLCAISKVYIQPSYYESFGVALVEAMSRGCVPIVTNRGSLREIVGDTGYYVEYGNPKILADTIKKALKSNLGKQAKERSKEMFSNEKRLAALINIINSLLK